MISLEAYRKLPFGGDEDRVVDRNVFGAVNWNVIRAANEDVFWAVYWAVGRDVDRAVNGAVSRTVFWVAHGTGFQE